MRLACQVSLAGSIPVGFTFFMKKYIPSQIEPKWQKKWEEDKLYSLDLEDPKNKYNVVVELPYTSGDLHIGHWFAFGVVDSFARFNKMLGRKVFFPIGFDSFGLPAENAAIKRGLHPRKWTLSNIELMIKQFKLMGSVLNWDSQIITCLPEYYEWNQWIFLKMYEKDIAYRNKVSSNWCPSCQTVLADEQVVAGKCDRCGTEVTKKDIDQWLLRITAYADRLEWGTDGNGVDWPKETMEGQNNWIGKSEGILIKFDDLEVFTTRADTIFGATFVVISPEHPLLGKYITDKQSKSVNSYVTEAKGKSELERKENKEKTGVFTGSYVKNPLTKKDIPVWVADYVLMSYGTGAIMAVPAHDERDFEFSEKFDLEIKWVIEPKGPWDKNKAYQGEGVLVNSGEYSGLSSSEAREKISEYIESNNLGKKQMQYHLHDWSISRQRYWGTPIPVIYCDACGIVPVPEEDLPVELPENVNYAPTGKSPLALAEDWYKVKCPKCGGNAKRDTDTMDGFVDNSWYFLRYLDPKNEREIASQKRLNDWMPIDVYFGGSEHTLGHTLYSRFFYKFLVDIKAIPDPSGLGEYAKKRVNHGVILGPNGVRMSKSKGNVVNPDEQVKDYGADAVRLYLSFIGPYDIVAPWNPDGINGVYHFLQRVWNLYEKVEDIELSQSDLLMIHKTIKKVGEDIEEIKFNTAIAALMEWLNYLVSKRKVGKEEYKTFLLLLAPFAPHITEELWSHFVRLHRTSRDGKWSIHQQSWPEFDSKYLKEEQISVIIQINGKVRDILLIHKDILNNKEVVEKKALESVKINKFLNGYSVKRSVYIPGRVLNLVI